MAHEQFDLFPGRNGDRDVAGVRPDSAGRIDPVDRSPKLYFISAIDDLDASQDLLVGADDPDEAVGYWRNYYELGPGHFPDQVFLVPAPTQHGPLRWHTDLIDQVIRGLCIKEAAQALGLETQTCKDCGELKEETVHSTKRHWECASCGAWNKRKPL